MLRIGRAAERALGAGVHDIQSDGRPTVNLGRDRVGLARRQPGAPSADRRRADGDESDPGGS